MKCLLVFAAVFIAAGLTAAPAEAGSWMFQRSYYSHNPQQPVEVGQRPRSGPFFTQPQGGSINSGYRNAHSTINVGGRTYDHLHIWQSWVQFGSQF